MEPNCKRGAVLAIIIAALAIANTLGLDVISHTTENSQ